ncbi:MAG: site-specific integrase, partial [Deltaproteobacteria bacterium]|nr:site-specific integrase [Deltaproteobacteria bacterium]
MPRPATGSARWNPRIDRWEARITLRDGSRVPVVLQDAEGRATVLPCTVAPSSPPKDCSCGSCSQARRVAKIVSDQARAEGAVPEQIGEVWNEWHARYIELHEELGKQTRGMHGASESWIADVFGTKPMASIARSDVIVVRDRLARAVLDAKLSAKRAMNIWSETIVAPFSRAFHDDDPRYASVRVGPTLANPTIGVKPPVTKEQLNEDRRERQPMYPHEFIQVLRCAQIPRAARRIYVLAAFLYCRPQELYALRWGDVDWEAREIRVRRKLDVRTGEEKPGTKSDAGIREIPIHENLMPLLRAMYTAAGEDDGALLIQYKGSPRLFDKLAEQVRRHLAVAKLQRRELLVGTPDLMPFDFRSFRTTGCTWLAMLGVDSYVIAQQAGHKSPETTWASYIKRGPDLRQRHGEPFPPPPAELLDCSPEFRSGLGSGPKRPRKNQGIFAERAGF